MPTGIYDRQPRIKDEFTHLGTKNAYYHRHKEEVRARLKELSPEQKARKRAKEKANRLANPEKYKEIQKRHREKRDPRRVILENAKALAKRLNLPFNITLEDIVVPEICPLAQIPLVFNKKKTRDNSPSLDKIVPSLGYVRGNTRVISRKGNRWKQEMTRDDVLRLLDYIDGKI